MRYLNKINKVYGVYNKVLQSNEKRSIKSVVINIYYVYYIVEYSLINLINHNSFIIHLSSGQILSIGADFRFSIKLFHTKVFSIQWVNCATISFEQSVFLFTIYISSCMIYEKKQLFCIRNRNVHFVSEKRIHHFMFLKIMLKVRNIEKKNKLHDDA